MQFTISGTFAPEPLKEPLRYWCQQMGVTTEYQFSAHQVFQDLLEKKGGRSEDVHLLLIRLQDLLTSTERAAPVRDLAMSLTVIVDELFTAAANSPYAGTRLFLFSAPSYDIRADDARYEKFLKAEQQLVSKLETLPNCFAVSSVNLAALYPVAEVDNAYGSSDVPYLPAYYAALATGAVRKLTGVRAVPQVLGS